MATTTQSASSIMARTNTVDNGIRVAVLVANTQLTTIKRRHHQRYAFGVVVVPEAGTFPATSVFGRECNDACDNKASYRFRMPQQAETRKANVKTEANAISTLSERHRRTTQRTVRILRMV
jgi:hypothetical protein